MFGYLIASTPKLTPDELNRYKECYCGLCRCLGQRHGNFSRLMLNYDMTFLVLLLQSLYEFDESKDELNCIIHPVKKQPFAVSNATSYAADMLLILSYFKFLDDWNDDKSSLSLLSSKIIEKKVELLKSDYPRQYKAISSGIDDLSKLEKDNSDDIDAAADSFGKIMAEIFVYKEDRWSETLYNLGNALGHFIYLIDAAVDLEDDHKKGSYNPLDKFYGQDNYIRFQDYLKIFLSEAIVAFDMLPLVDDVGIMKNILCSGLWAKFEEKYGSIQGSGR